MSREAQAAKQKIYDVIAKAVSPLSPAEYRDVLEDLASDIEGRLDALGEELADDE